MSLLIVAAASDPRLTRLTYSDQTRITVQTGLHEQSAAGGSRSPTAAA